LSKIRTLGELREAIRDLEHQNYVNEQHMRSRVAEVADRLKPANLIRNLVSQWTSGADMRMSLWKIAAGIVTSLIVKKFFRKGISR
jgi:hypothetical protein